MSNPSGTSIPFGRNPVVNAAFGNAGATDASGAAAASDGSGAQPMAGATASPTSVQADGGGQGTAGEQAEDGQAGTPATPASSQNGGQSILRTGGSSGNANELGVGGAGTASPGVSQPLDPALKNASNALRNGDVDSATGHYTDFLTRALNQNGLEGLDINGIIQAVLMEAYKDNQSEAKDWAEKLHFITQRRAAIRQDLNQANKDRATNTHGDKIDPPMTRQPSYSPNPGPGGNPVRVNAVGNASSASGSSSSGASGSSGTSSGAQGSTAVQQPGSVTSGGSGVTVLRPGDAGFPASLQPPQNWVVFKASDGSLAAVNFKGALDANGQPLKGADGKPLSTAGVGEVRTFNAQGVEQSQVWGQGANLMFDGGQNYRTADGKNGANNDGSTHGTGLHGNSAIYMADGTQISLSIGNGADGKPQVNKVDVTGGQNHFTVDAGTDPTKPLTDAGDGASFASGTALVDPSKGAQLAVQSNGQFAIRNPRATDSGSGSQWNQLGFQDSANTGADYNRGATTTNVSGDQQQTSDGQAQSITTTADADAYVKDLQSQIDDSQDDSQEASTKLQDITQRSQELMTMLTGLSKNWHDTAMSIVRNIS